MTALRAHALQSGRLHSHDPDQLLSDLEIPSRNPNSVAIGISGLRRPRGRRDHDTLLTFGIAPSAVSNEVPQANSGLGAALLSLFDDIVANDSCNHDDLMNDLDDAGSGNDEQPNVKIRNSNEGSISGQKHEMGTVGSFYIETESFKLSEESEALFQVKHVGLNNVVSVEMPSAEHSVQVVSPNRTQRLSVERFTTDSRDHSDNVVSPIQGVATPRRAKVTYECSRDVTKPARLSSSVRQEMQSENDAEMDM